MCVCVCVTRGVSPWLSDLRTGLRRRSKQIRTSVALLHIQVNYVK